MARRKRLDFAGVADRVHIGETAREILHKTVDDGVADMDMAKEIRWDLVEPDPEQPRKHFDEESLRELAQSIRLQGVLQPIVVEWMAERERFRIISGERRWRAVRLAAQLQEEAQPAGPRRDLGRIPAIVKNPSAIDRYLQQVYENEQRQDYSDVERAFAYERLKEALGLTWEELAAKLGLSKGRIHQIRRTKNRLAPSVQGDITSGRLTGRHGLYLAPLPERAQEAVAKAAKEHHLTHQQTKELAERVRRTLQGAPNAAGLLSMPRPASAAPASDSTESKIGEAKVPPAADLTEHVVISPTPPPPGESAPSVAQVVEQTVVEVTAPRPEIPRARREDLDKALALVRQLLRLDLKVPPTAAERAKLAGALDELIAWAEGLRAQLRA